jgi:trk system potassium uptake protein TrkH
MRFQNLKLKMTNTRIIALGFAAVILVGTLLLCLPFSSANGDWTHPIDALFTATTATCVTGLVTVDTGLHWSFFGQIVILLMIQIGGIGFMTLFTLFSFFLRRQVSLHERRLLLQSAGALHMGGVMGTFRQILIGTLVVEGLGAAILYHEFYPLYGAKGLWYAIFHSISAFCNAGMDLLGNTGSVSFIAYSGDALVSGTLMFLIIMGGLGFLVWNDLLKSRFRFRKMELHTKLVLVISAVLILGGWILFYLTERNASMAHMSEGERLLASLFQSVTTRTAGFVTVDQSSLSNSGSLISMVLMFIGGSPGSTAGGAKTTTVAVFLLCSWHLSHNREAVVTFKRRIDDRIVRQAGAVVCFYLMMILTATVVICALEPAGLREVLYEVVSAMATVGLSMNLTSTLCAASKLILIILMYAGRLGGLSLFLALAENTEQVPLERPTEKILIG